MTKANVLSPGRWVRACGLVLGLAGGLTQSRAAWAQVTPESLISGALTDKGPYYDDLSQAIARFRGGDVEGARGLLAAARAKAPKLSPPEVMLGALLADVGQAAAARAELEKAIHLYPRDPEAYLRLAEVDAADGRRTEAGLLFAKASDLADDFGESPRRRRQVQMRALSGAASIAENHEQWSAARDYLQALVRLEPENAGLLGRLGKALFKVGDIDEAGRALAAAAAADAKSPPADLVLATLFSQSGEKAKAEECIQRLADAGADNLATRLGLARWLLQAGEVERAQTHADKARQLDPDNVEAKVVTGVVLRLRKDPDAAQALLEQAHLQSPVNVDVNNQLALLLIGKTDEASRLRAVEFAELNQRLYPNNPEIVATLAWVFFQQGRQAEAERLFRAIAATLASGSAPVSGDAVYYLASFRAAQGKPAEARRLLALLLSRGLAGFYRQEAESLLTELGGPESATAAPGAAEETPGAEKAEPKLDAPKP